MRCVNTCVFMKHERAPPLAEAQCYALEIRDGIIFDFCHGLPHISHLSISNFHTWTPCILLCKSAVLVEPAKHVNQSA